MKTLILAAFAVIALGMSVGDAFAASHAPYQQSTRQNYMEGGGG